MIYELTTEKEFAKVAELVNTSEFNNSFAQSVLEGNTLGWVFVDDKINPKSAMIWPRDIECAEVAFIGDYQNEFFTKNVSSFVDSVLKDRLLKEGKKCFEYYGDHSNWNVTFENIFSTKKGFEEKMLRYKFDELKNIEETLPQGYEIVSLDIALCNNENISNKENFILGIKCSWGSLKNFFIHSYGYVLISDSAIAGWCTACCRNGKYVQIDIEIDEEHWGKKLGTVIAAKQIDECVKRGDIPEWQASEAAPASQKIAEKVGFVYESVYPVFGFKL